MAAWYCHIFHFRFFILYRSGTLESVYFGRAVSRLRDCKFVPMLHKSYIARDYQQYSFCSLLRNYLSAAKRSTQTSGNLLQLC